MRSKCLLAASFSNDCSSFNKAEIKELLDAMKRQWVFSGEEK
jgi:hypothetical protein